MKLNPNFNPKNIIFCPEQHIVAVGQYEIRVFDSIRLVEIETYPLTSKTSVMMFSKDGNKIYALTNKGQIYVIDRIKKKAILGNKIGIQRMIYEADIFENGFILPLLSSEGFMLVVPGEQYRKQLNDWYYVDDLGHIKNYFSISYENCMGYSNVKNHCNFGNILNNPFEDGSYYFNCYKHRSILCFKPDKMEFSTLYELKNLENVRYISKKNNFMLLSPHLEIWRFDLPKNPNQLYKDLNPKKLADGSLPINNYAATARNTNLDSDKTCYFDVKQMKIHTIPDKYFRPCDPDMKSGFLLDMDNIRYVATNAERSTFYNKETDEVIFQ